MTELTDGAPADATCWQPLKQHSSLSFGANIAPCALRSETGQVQSGSYRFLQVTLADVSASLLQGLPAESVLTQLATRHFMARVKGAQFPWELALRNKNRLYNATGVVCVQLKPAPTETDRRTQSHLRDVQRASRSGLLDDAMTQHADFRLHNRSRLRRLAAGYDTGYVPDNEWQLVVIFAQWRAAGTDDWVPSPLMNASDDETPEVKFSQAKVKQNVRVSDLFQPRH